MIGAAVLAGSLLIYVFLEESLQAEDSYAEQIMTECEGKLDCTMEALRDISETEEQSTVLVIIKDIISTYEKSSYQCHKEGHHLGMFLYDYTGNLTQSLSYVEPKCGGAVYHGIIEGFFTEQSLNNANPAEINVREICPATANNPYAIHRWECLHGLGHGLSVLYRQDVFTAIHRCDELEPGWERVNCYTGVFMQNVINYYKSEDGALEEDDLLFPCNTVNAKYAPACYFRQTDHIYKQNRFSPTTSFKECDKIIPEEFVKYCYFGMGVQIFYSYLALDRDFDASARQCQKGQPRYHVDCFGGLVRTILDATNTDEAFEFCKHIPRQSKVYCYEIIGQYGHMLHSNNQGRANECSKAESREYFEVCMKADIESIILL